MKVTAKLNYLRISPRKVRAVVNVVKNMEPREAMLQLKFIPNRASVPLVKLIKSALANAENNFSLDATGLKITEFKVDGGPVFKRFRPGSRGRVAPLRKKTSHITLVLEGSRSISPAKKSVLAGKGSAADVSESRSQKPEYDTKREDVFKSKNIPVKKKTGFVKKMFQRKSV
ncbi:MAG: 50S ribosomal protein L22 [Parcubacteria group bacterium]|nr:50S ribosomal protein L22 [Parcubacteria group bacterium]